MEQRQWNSVSLIHTHWEVLPTVARQILSTQDTLDILETTRDNLELYIFGAGVISFPIRFHLVLVGALLLKTNIPSA